MRQPLIGFIAVVLLGISIFFTIKMAVFLQTALRADGEVTYVEARNTTCSRSGGGRHRRRSRSYPCTKFTMHVQFYTNMGEEMSAQFSAGSSRGHGMSLASASKQVGNRIPVVYDPKNPATVYQDKFFALWGLPLMLGGFGIIMMFVSTLPPKGSKYRY